MDKDQFWQMIDTARETGGIWQNMYLPLRDALMELDASDIIHWQQIFYEYQSLSYKEKLWAAAYTMMDGCSDDSFDYFRGWLTAQGKEVFMNALADPDSLAEVDSVRDFRSETLEWDYTPSNGYFSEVRFEGMLYVAVDAYERKTGGDFYSVVNNYPLTMQEKAKIAEGIVYAADMDGKWGGFDIPRSETEVTLKKILPKLYGLFQTADSPEITEATAVRDPKEKESVLEKIMQSKGKNAQPKSKTNKRDKGGQEL